MTWQELADFINNKMPECNRNEEATIWNGASDEGEFNFIHDITPFDGDEKSSEYNFYSVNVRGL